MQASVWSGAVLADAPSPLPCQAPVLCRNHQPSACCPPQVPDPDQLPATPFAGQAEYLALMQECWAQDPAARPSFAAVISRLRKMLALEAQRQRSVRAAGGGGGGGRPESPLVQPGSAGGGDTPAHVSSRPIVSVYELSADPPGGVLSHRTSDDAARSMTHSLARTEVASLATLPEAVGTTTASLATLATPDGSSKGGGAGARPKGGSTGDSD